MADRLLPRTEEPRQGLQVRGLLSVWSNARVQPQAVSSLMSDSRKTTPAAPCSLLTLLVLRKKTPLTLIGPLWVSQGKCVFTDACADIFAVVCIFRVQATEQFSGVFLRNHLGSKKNTSVIIVITFCNYPYATLLEQRKTTVSLLPRSPPEHARPFHGAARFKGGVTLRQLCQHSDETRKHSVDGKALVFKAP